MLQFAVDNLEVSKGWSNARLDALIESMKASGIDVRKIMRQLREEYPP